MENSKHLDPIEGEDGQEFRAEYFEPVYHAQ